VLFSRARPLILVIDDDASLRRQLRARLVTHEAVDVVEAENGVQGLLQAKEHNPDLIILDWMMPDIQGDEVLARLRRESKTKTTPVIMLTGKNKFGDVESAFDLGADVYLTKPFTLQQVGLKVRELLKMEK
jgi:DNA-binding response OmpR family regulator